MSPFTHQQELWLTQHLERLVQHEKATQIQAVARGFLVRHRQEKDRKAKALVDNAIRNLMVPKEPVSVRALMVTLQLHPWADTLPSAEQALMNLDARAIRDSHIWHASMSLRLTGQSQYIQQLQWADYHERYQALCLLRDPEPVISSTPSFWGRVTKWIWG